MLSPIEEVYARMNLLQNLYETIVANNLANCTPEQSTDFKVKLISTLRKAQPSRCELNSAGEQKEAEIRYRMVELAQEFIDSVSELEEQLRAFKALMQPGRDGTAARQQE